jgi:hypothetical protein
VPFSKALEMLERLKPNDEVYLLVVHDFPSEEYPWFKANAKVRLLATSDFDLGQFMGKVI